MTVTAGVPVIGRVERVNRERKIASVKPIYHDVGHGWEAADSSDYPTRGRLFWRGAVDVEFGEVITCRVEHNPNGEDHFAVSEPSVLPLVEDMRPLSYADATEKLRARTNSPTAPDQREHQVYLWCADDMLVGPFKVGPVRTPSAVFAESGRLGRVPVRHGEQAVLTAPDGRLYCDPSVPPVAFVDCRSDADILRTALHDAVEVLNEAGHPTPVTLSTKKQIDQAAALLRVGESSGDRTSKLARLERALTVCAESSIVTSRATELADALLSHPAVSAELDRIRKSTRAEALTEGRRDFESELSTLRNDENALRRELADLDRAVTAKRDELTSVARAVDRQLDELESRVVDRVGQAVDNASELLADSVMFRALGHASATPVDPPKTRTGRLFGPSKDAVAIDKTAEFDQCLRAAASAYGLPHAALRRIHAAVRAGLVPIVTGNGADAALTAYAKVACAGRVASLPVAHDFLSPVDLLGVRASDPAKQRLHADLLLAANREAETDGPAMLVLQSVNQAPTEAFLLPWLQAHDRGIAVPPAARDVVGCSRVVIHGNVLLAATAVAGATTAPLSPDIWGFCVAIDVPAAASIPAGHVTATRLGSQSPASPAPRIRELAERLDKVLGEYWVVDDGLTTAAQRFGTTLQEIARGGSVENAIAMSVLLPAIATSVPGPELADAADAVAKWCGTGNVNTAAFRRLAHRFQRTFA
ncbi:hypothetical protein ACWPOB_08080 [Rhodococcus sp. 2H158]